MHRYTSPDPRTQPTTTATEFRNCGTGIKIMSQMIMFMTRVWLLHDAIGIPEEGPEHRGGANSIASIVALQENAPPLWEKKTD